MNYFSIKLEITYFSMAEAQKSLKQRQISRYLCLPLLKIGTFTSVWVCGSAHRNV